MKDDLSRLNDQWKSVGYLGAGFAASQVTKAITGNTIEEHLEAEAYHKGDRKKARQSSEQDTLISGIVGSLFGAMTGYLSKGDKGVFEGAVLGGIASAGITLIEKKLKA